MSKGRIILADAQPMYRAGVKAVLEKEEQLEILAEANDAGELIPQLQLYKPDILIIDYNPVYFESNGLLEWLKKNTTCKVIIISSQDKKWNIIKSLQLNVYAYLTKESTDKEIIKGVSQALLGKKYFCQYILNLMVDQNNSILENDLEKLTQRELEIARLVATGKKNKDIADQLNISPHTIHTHRKNILKKLNVSSAAELASIIFA